MVGDGHQPYSRALYIFITRIPVIKGGMSFPSPRTKELMGHPGVTSLLATFCGGNLWSKEMAKAFGNGVFDMFDDSRYMPWQ